jgi:hypothetical protein
MAADKHAVFLGALPAEQKNLSFEREVAADVSVR